MQRNNRAWLRAAALLMAIVMTAGLFPAAAFADEADEDVGTVVAETEAPPLVNVIQTGGPEDEETLQDAGGKGTDSADDRADIPEDGGEPVDLNAEAETDDPDADAEPTDALEPPVTDGDGDSDAPTAFTVTYLDAQGELIAQESVTAGEEPVNIPVSDLGTGWHITAWTDADGVRLSIDELPVTADVSYFACVAPPLEKDDHIVYINGRTNGKFEPYVSLTRAEAAIIIYQLLGEPAVGRVKASFTDVAESAWYYEAVHVLTSYGILSGYEETDGTYTFRPNNPVTRAEFITILVGVTGAEGCCASFTDIGSHWARDYIEAAAANGWISGYEETDGTHTFRPDNPIRRCEAVTVLNGVLGRQADTGVLTANGSVIKFPDVVSGDWFYGEVMEASISHTYEKTDGSERWLTSVLPDKQAAGIYKDGSSWYMIDDAGQRVYFRTGITKVDGKFYYAPSAGYAFTGQLNLEPGYCVFADGSRAALADKFNRIGYTLFYWDLASASAMELNAGLNTILGTTYWADEKGFVIRNNFFEGVVELGGKKYLSRGYSDIITSGSGYVTTRSLPSTVDLKNRTFEYNNKMYYVKSDYSLACGEWVDYMYFGADCAYTSGDATLDGYVWNVVKDFINNNALTKEQKLLKAYYYLRGGEGASYAASPFKYINTNEGYERGYYNTPADNPLFIYFAKRMYSQGGGRCYEWAAGYLYLARRLGFKAYPVVGSVFNTGARHCWCMIEWDGYWHISDVEIEWGYLAGYYDHPTYRNLFAQTVSSEYFYRYTNPECGLNYWVWEE